MENINPGLYHNQGRNHFRLTKNNRDYAAERCNAHSTISQSQPLIIVKRFLTIINLH
jgi:hypothetical protein